MGGKKKLTLKQMERMQQRKDKAEGDKQRKSSGMPEKKSTKIIVPQISDDVKKEIKRMKVLTPYTVASRFDLRLSIAKDFLQDLHQRGVIAYVSGDRNLKIYKPVD